MIRLLIITAFAACAPPARVAIIDTDDQMEAPVAELIAELEDLGAPVVMYAKDAPLSVRRIHVRMSSERLSRYMAETPESNCTAGLWVSSESTVYVASDTEFSVCERKSQSTRLTPAGVKLVLAHELGHAGGILKHTDSGLMAISDTSCLDTVAECLIEVLAWQ